MRNGLIAVALILIQLIVSHLVLTLGLVPLLVASLIAPMNMSLLYIFLAVIGIIFGTIYLVIINKFTSIAIKQQVIVLIVLGLAPAISLYLINMSFTTTIAASRLPTEGFGIAPSPNLILEIFSYFVPFVLPSLWKYRKELSR